METNDLQSKVMSQYSVCSVPAQLSLRQISWLSNLREIKPKFNHIDLKQSKQDVQLLNFSLNKYQMNKNSALRQNEDIQKSVQKSQTKKITRTIKRQSLKKKGFKKQNSNIQGFKTAYKKNKTEKIAKIFINKLKRFNSKVKLINNIQYQNEQQDDKQYKQGIYLNQKIQNIINLIFLIVNFVSIYFVTISLGFQLQDLALVHYYEKTIIFFSILQIISKSCLVKQSQSNTIKHLYLIVYNYLSQDLIIDAIFLLTVIASRIDIVQNIHYLKLIVLLKLPWMLEKLQKIEIYFIQSTYREHYWSVIKVFLFNFCYAHLLALILNQMGYIDPQNSWFKNKPINVSSTPWYQIYIWSYYWAVNIMLTVGFGDISAQIYQQAFVLIFIQTFSCIVLAYNINFVGVLIAKIRQQDFQKNKKLKILRGLAVKNKISNNFLKKIANYVSQSTNINKKFNIQEENEFVNNLPIMFKNQFLAQSTKTIFENIRFFRNFSNKTLKLLAQSLQTKVTHPNQMILNKENFRNIKILRQGTIGYCTKMVGSIINGKLKNQLQIKEGQNASLFNISFIYNIEPNYQIKSLNYSIIHSISEDKLIESLKSNNANYQYYCFLKDKHEQDYLTITDIFCTACSQHHTKFHCPKQHLMLFPQHVIFKYLHKSKKSVNKRLFINRIFYKNINALQIKWPQNQIINMSKKNLKSVTFNNEQLNFGLNFQDFINYSKTQIQNPYSKISKNTNHQKFNQTIRKYFNSQNLYMQDEVWSIKLDLLQDYSNYFPIYNSKKLVNKFLNILDSNSKINIIINKYGNIDQVINQYQYSYLSNKRLIDDSTFKNKQITFQQQLTEKYKNYKVQDVQFTTRSS